MIRRGVPLLVLAVVAGLGASWPSPVAARGAEDPAASAISRLRHDADPQVRVRLDAVGRLSGVTTATGAEVDNPEVTRATSLGSAARSHLSRYGAGLGAAEGSTLRPVGSHAGPSGVDVVRFEQQVSGVRVLGGEVVLGLGPDRELRSLSSAVSTVDAVVGDSAVPVADLEATALAAVRRTHPGARLGVVDQGRRLLDPVLVDVDLPAGSRTVQQLEVGDGAGIRELVLVDDVNGSVVLRSNLIAHLDRVVCDQANVRVNEPACTTGFARTESGDPSEVVDVEQAFENSGQVADFYTEVGGVDLTALLGRDTDTGKHLASTVRYCPNIGFTACPYDNAFWNGIQMYYGQGYAVADDVVAHEITHGFIDQRSKLFYWGQSGAMNESMADVIGEIVDHRNGIEDDRAWGAGEDLPGGALRSLSDPTLHGQPDRMTSPLWTADTNYEDNGGVHTNSGVANKTAYLISQGGDFNGQTITGIDGTDPGLTKTARLYLDVIGRLSSGADHAQLATVLEQSCADLRTVPAAGFTAEDCGAVHQATVATELRTPPVVGTPPPPADTTCPVGTTKNVLLDAESGDPLAAMSRVEWSRPTAAGGTNAYSGTSSWFAENRSTAGYRALRTVLVDLPVGQQAYLSFQHWWLLDYEPGAIYDGGTVEVLEKARDSTVTTTYLPGSAAWVNGPDSTIKSGFGNPKQGQRAFGADSRGWRSSRLDLTEWAGKLISPQFNLATDSSVAFIGWYVDDIQVYTCHPDPGPVAAVSTIGVPRSSANGPVKQRIKWTAPTLNPTGVTGYQVSVDGVLRATTGPAARSVDLALTTTARHTVTVRSVGAPGFLAAGRSATTVPSTLTLTATRAGSVVAFSGILRRAGSAMAGHQVWIERKSGTGWVGVGSTSTRADGTYAWKYTRSTAAAYRVRFAGTVGVTGVFSPLRTK